MYYAVGTTISFSKKKVEKQKDTFYSVGAKVRFVQVVESLTFVPVKNSFA